MSKEYNRDEIALREVLQAKLLSAVFANDVSDQLLLKGGMAMRVAHGSYRSTKDIDLECDNHMPLVALQKVVKKAIKKTMETGYLENVTVTEPKQTETTARWKINGIVTGGETKVQLTVEVSRRDSLAFKMKRTREIMYEPCKDCGVDPFMITTYDPQMMALSKISCLTNPTRAAPRDLYDLHILIESKIEPPTELLVAEGERFVDDALAELYGKIEILTWDKFKAEVLPFMRGGDAEKITEEDFLLMQVKVADTVEGWLKDAKDKIKQNGDGGIKP